MDAIDAHGDDGLRRFWTRITNGVLEAIDSLVQAAQRRARGRPTDKHSIATIYVTSGRLDFGLPTANGVESKDEAAGSRVIG